MITNSVTWKNINLLLSICIEQKSKYGANGVPAQESLRRHPCLDSGSSSTHWLLVQFIFLLL
jgi:hypothetical protein